MKKILWSHRVGLAVFALWAASACGGEARSESELPAGGTVVAELDPVERPTLIERDEGAAAVPAAAVPAEGSAVPVRADDGGASPLGEEQARAEPATIEPAPLPRYTTREEPAPSAGEQRREPSLTATDGEGQIVEAEIDENLDEIAEAEVDESRDAEEPEAMAVPVGVELELAVESEVSTERNRPGDFFYATLVDDLLADDGLVLLAQGTRLRGVVTESLPSESADVLPVLDFEIEAVVTDTGDWPVSAVVVYADLAVDERDSGEETAVKVITGAAAGAILGRILGDDKKDAVKGGVAGAAAGAAVALGTRGGHARLEPGSLIVVRLERPLIVAD